VNRTLLVGLGAAAVLLAACSSPDETDFRDAASGVIEGDLADNLSIEALEATCEDPSSKDVGTMFTCTATTPEGDELTFNAEIRDDEQVFVYTTNYDRVARILIEGQLASSLGVDELTATCDEPASKDVGTTFGCVADLPGGDKVTVDATVQDRGEVAVQTTNLLTQENLATIESEAARILSEQVGQTLPAENIDCGDQPMVAEAGEPFVCALTDPSGTGDVYDAMITLDDLANPTQLDVEVASAPRA
jgi:hypothetical protein